MYLVRLNTNYLKRRYSGVSRFVVTMIAFKVRAFAITDQYPHSQIKPPSLTKCKAGIYLLLFIRERLERLLLRRRIDC